MKKNIKIFICFFLVFCLLFSIANLLVVKVDSDGHKIIREFYNQRQNSLDGVYIGASHSFAYWNPLFAWKEYGICISTFGCNLNPFYSTEYVIKEAKKTQPNATFIVNLNSLSSIPLDESHMYYIVNSMKFSRTKLDLIDHLCTVSGYTGLERAEYYFPFVRFHSRWPWFYTGNKLTTHPDGFKGSFVYSEYLEVSEDVSSIYKKPEKTVELPDELIYSTNKLLKYIEAENVNILFVVVPQARENADEVNRIETMASYISSKGYTVLNLTEIADEEFDLDLTKDYYNGSHTNIHGSIKYTNYLSEYLIENYGFKDKRDNKDYSDWHTSYENYMEVVSPYILDIELDSNHRDFNIKEPTLKVKSERNSVKITWNSVKGADGYRVYKKVGDSSWECVSEVFGNTSTPQYLDGAVSKGETYSYTVVPFATKNQSNYYGDFNYIGVSIEF